MTLSNFSEAQFSMFLWEHHTRSCFSYSDFVTKSKTALGLGVHIFWPRLPLQQSIAKSGWLIDMIKSMRMYAYLLAVSVHLRSTQSIVVFVAATSFSEYFTLLSTSGVNNAEVTLSTTPTNSTSTCKSIAVKKIDQKFSANQENKHVTTTCGPLHVRQREWQNAI